MGAFRAEALGTSLGRLRAGGPARFAGPRMRVARQLYPVHPRLFLTGLTGLTGFRCWLWCGCRGLWS